MNVLIESWHTFILYSFVGTLSQHVGPTVGRWGTPLKDKWTLWYLNTWMGQVSPRKELSYLRKQYVWRLNQFVPVLDALHERLRRWVPSLVIISDIIYLACHFKYLYKKYGGGTHWKAWGVHRMIYKCKATSHKLVVRAGVKIESGAFNA